MENKYVRSRKTSIRQELGWAVKTLQKRKAVLPAMNQALICWQRSASCLHGYIQNTKTHTQCVTGQIICQVMTNEYKTLKIQHRMTGFDIFV